MTNCAFCGISISDGEPAGEGVSYCCASCSDRARELDRVYKDLDFAYEATMEALVAALDVREQKTADHSRRVARYSMILAQTLKVEPDLCRRICRGALLHDIGKIGVPDAILLKQGPLTEDEWKVMRKHPELGARILDSVPFLSDAREIVLHHQERFDGSGYPAGLKGEKISFGARIFAVADTLDALLSDRPYHKGMAFEAAIDEIGRQAGATLDPQVVEALAHSEDKIRGVSSVD
jgi:putative nucleotidyltransferase with HDIG domain